MTNTDIQRTYSPFLKHDHAKHDTGLSVDSLISRSVSVATPSELFNAINNTASQLSGHPGDGLLNYIKLFDKFQYQFDQRSCALLMTELTHAITADNCQHLKIAGQRALCGLANEFLKSGRQRKLSVDQLAEVLENFSRIGCYDREIFNRIFEKIREHDHIGYFNCARIVHAVADLRLRPVKLMDHIALICIRNKKPISPDSLATIVWSFAHVNHIHQRLFRNMADRLLQFYDSNIQLNVKSQSTLGKICYAYAISDMDKGYLGQAVWDTSVSIFEKNFLGKDGRIFSPDSITLSQIAHSGLAVGRKPAQYMIDAIQTVRANAYNLLNVSREEDVIAGILSDNRIKFCRQVQFYGYILDFRIIKEVNGQQKQIALEYNGKLFHQIRDSGETADRELGNFLLKRKVLSNSGYHLIVIDQEDFENLKHQQKRRYILDKLDAVAR